MKPALPIVMTRQETIAGLKRRVARAESKRDASRFAGEMESYLGAYTTVEALELQLDQAERAQPMPAEHPAPARPVAQSSGHAALMAELGIHYNGRSYQYRGYRYDRLEDAVNYARLDRARTLEDSPSVAAIAPLEVVNPSDDPGGELMRELGITFKDGFFCLRDYRYDRLADAVAYADRRAGRC